MRMNVDSEGGLRYTLFSNKRKKVTVHFVHSNVLDGLWINTSIEKIGNVSVPQGSPQVFGGP